MASKQEVALFGDKAAPAPDFASEDKGLGTEADALAHINTLDNPGDYIAQETHKHWLMVLNPETGAVDNGAVIYMKNTQLGPSRAWNTEIVKTDAPRFASVWQLGGTLQRNNRNDEYANYTFTFLGWVSKELYEQLKPMYHAIVEQAKATSLGEEQQDAA